VKRINSVKGILCGLAVAVALTMTACGSGHTAAWETGYKAGQAHKGGDGDSSTADNCQSELLLLNTPGPYKWGTNAAGQFSNGFMAGCQ
jgi:hypothetical protein